MIQTIGLLLLTLSPALEEGTHDMKSVGALAFSPDGVLFVADSKGGAVFAIAPAKSSDRPADARHDVEGIDRKIAALLGTTPDEILIHDLAIAPSNGWAYLSVSRGRGPDAIPVLMQVAPGGEVAELELKYRKVSRAVLRDLPEDDPSNRRNPRNDAITDLLFVDGRLMVAKISNEAFSSQFSVIPYPFGDAGEGTTVEIFHGAHGKLETNAPIRTFTAYEIGGEPYLLAAYTCTPLVKIPIAALKPGAAIRGTTIAELGNRNRPLDMVVYQKDGKDHILIANSARGVMKVTTTGIGEIEGITEKVGRGDTAGLTYDTIDWLKGVVQMDTWTPGTWRY